MNVLRAVGLTLLAIVALLAILFAATLVTGWNLANERMGGEAPALRVAADSTLVERGNHLVRLRCVPCHAPRGSQVPAGGDVDYFASAHGSPLGRLYAPNLTPGGPLARWSDAEVARAIRQGVDRDGRSLFGMPSAQLRVLSDRDLAAVIAALRATSPIERAIPARELSVQGLVLVGLHALESSRQVPVRDAIADPPPGFDAAHGEYLAALLGCRDCHGQKLDGARAGQLTPMGPDLRKFVRKSDLARFASAVRGEPAAPGAKRPPHPGYLELNDTEVGALYTLLQQPR